MAERQSGSQYYCQECISAGYVALEPFCPTKKKALRLTDRGRIYAKSFLNQFYEMERRAMGTPLAGYSRKLIKSVELFAHNKKKETEKLPLEIV